MKTPRSTTSRGGAHAPAKADDLALSRRRLLQAPAFAVASAAVPALAAPTFARAAADPKMPPPGDKTAADYPVSDTMRQLSEYIAEAPSKSLPAEVVERAKWHILDTFAAIVSGSQLRAGRGALQYVSAYGGKPVATVIASRIVCGPVEAAMANGEMAHADETDDILGAPGQVWHPGTNVLPAALALGEQLHIDGEHLLRSVVLGYDIGTRVMRASGVTLDYKHPTFSMGGFFGAAAAAAAVARFTPQQTRWALSYAAQQCAGIDSFRRDPDHMEKAFTDAAMGAQAGVQCALLIRAGFTSVNDVFSGQGNFFTAYEATARPEELVAGLGRQFYITESDFKRHPIGGPTQAAVEAIEVLQRRRAIDHTQVREIVIRHRADSITDNSGPLAINVQHVVALMLVDGKVNFRNVHDPARAKDPRILRLRSISRLTPAGPQPGAGPGANRNVPAIRIVLADGTTLEGDAGEEVRGSASRPYTRDWVVKKATALMAPVLGPAKTDQLVDRVLHLEQVKSVLALRPLLQATTGGPPRLSEWPAAGSD